jgi:trigger factor
VLDVKEVLRVTAPAIDDELAKGLDFDSLASLREDLRTRIGTEKERIGKIQQEDQCLQQLLDRHTFGLPGSLVDEQQLASLRQFAARLEQSGMQREDIEKKLEESKGEARTDAERRVRLFFLIEGVARQQKLFVTENDVEGEVRKIAQSNGVAPQAVVEHLEKNNQMGELRLALLERKVRDFLRENARLVDKKAS